MKGVTLIEFIISVSIFSIIIVAAFSLLNTNTIWRSNMEMVDLQQQARLGMDWILRQVREAENVIITNINSNNDRIDFDTPSTSDYAIYRDTSDVNGNSVVSEILLEHPTGTYKALGRDITSLRFTISGNVIEISLSASKAVLNKTLSFPLKERISLRN